MRLTTHEAFSPEQALAATIRLPQHVVFRPFPTETVVLNLNSGKYHSLNLVGGRMLEVLDKVRSFHTALGLLQAEFDDQDPAVVEADLYRFCLDLQTRGLIEVVEA